ncbi:MAG TPA: GntR family transcriptional regulator [Acidimicrobiia bacterium]|nr:GntR family transcriptional regulator [Acidimicrobiia bacterium]
MVANERQIEGHLTSTGRLRSDILAGLFSPGERLTEVALAEKYSVGRGSIRAALLELRAEGLVDIEANRGAVVRRITVDEAIEIAEARKVLEGLVAGKAALSDDIEAKDSLASIIEDMGSAVSAADSARYSELNRVLHRRIWEIGEHRVANDLVANLRNRSAHHQYRLAMMPGRAEESLAQHAAVVEAIVAGDAEAAEKAMREHLSSVIDVLGHWAESGVNL